ncbi:MAG TPA: hypothetical protein VHW44_29730 [Pseudonocardiaceae bacterium]|jgi:hypothetical protein|nr:hypothetical protein [Pseudonocardiaceae bacterium]
MSGYSGGVDGLTQPRSRPVARPTATRAETKQDTAESLAELCERFEALCASAVDPLEIAAALESDGLSDQAARVRYGVRDVFALAERMYCEVPRDPIEPDEAPDPWRSPVSRHLLHGVLFGLPALCYPVAASLLTGGALTMLVVAALVSWAISQGMSYLGHYRLGRLDQDGSRRILRAGLLLGIVVLAGVLAAAGALVHARLPVLLFAYGQGIYLLGATVLLVAGVEFWLLGALGPAVGVGGVYLLLGQPAGLHRAAWLALVASVVLVVVLALVRSSWPRPAPARRVRLAELRLAAPYAIFGVLVAGLLMFPLVGAAISDNGPGVSNTALMATLPLSLSMGVAEWMLYWYRRRIRRLLRQTRLVTEFAGRSRLVLASALTRYALGAVLLMAALVGIAALTGHHPKRADLAWYGGYLAVGAALFLALLLQALGAVGAVLAWCSSAVAVEAVLVFSAPDAPVMRVQLVIGCGLLWGLLLNAGIVLARATRHR